MPMQSNCLASAATIKEHILIIDDEPEVVEVLLECARKAGANALGATSTVEAEQLLKTHTVFFMLIDFRMPQEDGVTFFERVREFYPSISAILVTAHADKSAAIRAMRANILDVIEKPFSTAAIVACVRTQVQKRLDAIAAESLALRAIAEGFVQESQEILNGIDSILLELEHAQGQERHIIDNLYRRVHTIKGCARSIPNTESVFQVAHAWETLLSAFREGTQTVSNSHIDNMLAAADTLKNLIENLFDEQQPAVDVAPLLCLLAPQKKNEPEALADDGIIWVTPPPGSDTQQTAQKNLAIATVSNNATQSSQHTPKPDSEASVLVNVKKIDSFLEVTGELVVLRNSLQSMLEGLIREGSVGARAVKPFAKELSEITARLQKDVLAVRRVRFDSMTQSLQRAVRETSRNLKKEIRLHIEGGESEVDRDIAKRLSAALIHIVRNACDHGIETPDERIANGKPREGKIEIIAHARIGRFEVVAKDDGKGLNREKILAKAIEKGIVKAELGIKLPDSDVFNFIFAPGFSTATVVSDVSGRGVGMDVVRTEISAVGGTVCIQSTAGQGASFHIAIPEIRSVLVEKLVVFSLGETKIALPMSSVSTIFQFTRQNVVEHPTRAEIEFQNQLQPILRPHEIFYSLKTAAQNLEVNETRMGVLLKHKNLRLALEVKDIERQIDAVIRPLDATTKNIPACTGIALLSDDEMAYALSAEKLFEKAYHTN